VPVLLYSGWTDHILEQTLEQHAALTARDVDVALTIGPWNHADLSLKAAGRVARDSLAWLEEHLNGPPAQTARRRSIRIGLSGSEAWRDLEAWPPPSKTVSLYLRAGGILDANPPADDEPPSRFTYDPADPTPTSAGLTEDSPRTDVLTFTGQVLAADLEVLGSPVVELMHSSDNPYADVLVRLCDVDPKAKVGVITERYVRLDAQEGDLTLVLAPTGHVFRAGHRLLLQVSGGSLPQYDRNLGTGEHRAEGTRMIASHREVAHGAGGRSVLRLPQSKT
jgi:putative CocE/NonD family hydrolase